MLGADAADDFAVGQVVETPVVLSERRMVVRRVVVDVLLGLGQLG